MKSMNFISRYLVEVAAGGGFKPGGVESVGDSNVAGVSFDQAVFSNVVTKNPAGKGFKGPAAGFGFGISVTPAVASFVSNFMATNAADEDRFTKDKDGNSVEKFKETGEADMPSWQQVNRAVGKYVRNKINNEMAPLRLGRVAQNPVGRYDGMDTSKIGVILDKKYSKMESKLSRSSKYKY
jgi:hypothetical protein